MINQYQASKRMVAAAGVLSLLAGCTFEEDQKAIEQISELTSRVDQLERDVAFANNALAAVRRDMPIQLFRTKVILDPSESAYNLLDSDFGRFAVTLTNVRQFGDGVKVTLNFGNGSSVTYLGAKVSLRYGARMPDMGQSDSSEKYTAWESAVQEKTIDITERLYSGRWNPVQITLPKIDEKQFGYLEVRISTNQISLL